MITPSLLVFYYVKIKRQNYRIFMFYNSVSQFLYVVFLFRCFSFLSWFSRFSRGSLVSLAVLSVFLFAFNLQDTGRLYVHEAQTHPAVVCNAVHCRISVHPYRQPMVLADNGDLYSNIQRRDFLEKESFFCLFSCMEKRVHFI